MLVLKSRACPMCPFLVLFRLVPASFKHLKLRIWTTTQRIVVVVFYLRCCNPLLIALFSTLERFGVLVHPMDNLDRFKPAMSSTALKPSRTICVVAIGSCVGPGSVGSTMYMVLSLLEKSLLGPFEVEMDTAYSETAWLGPMTSPEFPVTHR